MLDLFKINKSNQLKEIIDKLKKYYDFFSWLVSDSFLRNKLTSLKIVLSGALGVGFQIAAFATLLLYAQHFSADDPVNIAGQTFSAKDSLELLVLTSVVLSALLLISVFFIYYSKRSAIKMARLYEEYCAERIFLLLSYGYKKYQTSNNNVDSYILQLTRSDSRIAGRVLRRLLYTVTPTITFIASTIALFYLEMILTLLLTLFSAIIFFLQYRISIRASHHSKRFENLSSKSGEKYREVIKDIKYLSVPGRGSVKAKKLFSTNIVSRQLDAYEGRLGAVELSRFMSGIFMALVVGGILLVMGSEIINEGEGWARVLVYVIALRFAMFSMQAFFSSITSINRFYPQLHRYYSFIKSFTDDNQKKSVKKISDYKIYSTQISEKIPDSFDHISLSAGNSLALILPIELNRYNLSLICNVMFKHDESMALSAQVFSQIIKSDYSCPSQPLTEFLNIASTSTRDSLNHWFPSVKGWQEAYQYLPKDLNQTIRPTQWEKLPPSLKVSLALFSANQNKSHWIFCDTIALKKLDLETLHYQLGACNDAIRVYLYNDDTADIGQYSEQLVAVALDEYLLGLGTIEWFNSVKPRVSQVIGKYVKSSKNGLERSSSYQDDDDE